MWVRQNEELSAQVEQLRAGAILSIGCRPGQATHPVPSLRRVKRITCDVSWMKLIGKAHIYRVARRVSHRPVKQTDRVLFSCDIFQILKPRRSHISKAPVEIFKPIFRGCCVVTNAWNATNSTNGETCFKGWSSGWWFGTSILLSHILGIIIPIDFHIFQRGSNHQPVMICHCFLFSGYALLKHRFTVRQRTFPVHRWVSVMCLVWNSNDTHRRAFRAPSSLWGLGGVPWLISLSFFDDDKQMITDPFQYLRNGCARAWTRASQRCRQWSLGPFRHRRWDCTAGFTWVLARKDIAVPGLFKKTEKHAGAWWGIVPFWNCNHEGLKDHDFLKFSASCFEDFLKQTSEAGWKSCHSQCDVRPKMISNWIQWHGRDMSGTPKWWIGWKVKWCSSLLVLTFFRNIFRVISFSFHWVLLIEDAPRIQSSERFQVLSVCCSLNDLRTSWTLAAIKLRTMHSSHLQQIKPFLQFISSFYEALRCHVSSMRKKPVTWVYPHYEYPKPPSWSIPI